MRRCDRLSNRWNVWSKQPTTNARGVKDLFTTLSKNGPWTPKKLMMEELQVGGAPAEHVQHWKAPEIVESALKYTALTFRKAFNTNNKGHVLQRLKEVIHRGHSKSTFARNIQFLTPLPPLFVPVCFTCNPPSPFTPPNPSTYVRFSELPSPLSKKVPQRLWRLFRIKNRGVKRERSINLFVNST